MSREEILLREYETCQAESDASARNFWTTFGFFVSFSTAVIGGIIAFAVQKQAVSGIDPLWLGLLLMFCIVVLIVLFFLKSWLKRVDHFIGINNSRMREIELELGMKTKTRIWALDRWEVLCKNERKEQYQKLREEITQSFTFVSQQDKQKIADCRQQLPDDYEPPGTAKQLFFYGLFYPLISVWVILGLCIAGLLVRQLVC
jgi:hypothetical protein